MFRSNILILIIVAPLATALAQTIRTPDYNVKEAYEVYSTVLQDYRISGSTRPGELVILEETMTHFGSRDNNSPAKSTCLFPEPEEKETLQEIVDNLFTATQSKWRLKKEFKLDLKYRLFSNELTLSWDTNEKWDEFHRNFPQAKAIIGLSPVAFNSDKSMAIFSIHQWCGLLCGEGQFHFLQKKNGKWVPFEWKGGRCGWIA